MAEIKWNTQEFEKMCIGVGMDRLESAAKIVRDNGRRILSKKLTGMTTIRKENGDVVKRPWTEHGPYKSGKYEGLAWTERYKKEMVKTIRVVRKNDNNSRNVWIMMGNWKTWWAIQMEYGHGGWHGGSKGALRPALREAASAMQNVIENG